MDQGKFAYRKNLEQARKAVLDRAGSKFTVADPKQQMEIQKEGLMRPQSRPEPQDEGPESSGIGMALMEAMGAPEARPDYMNPQSPAPTQGDRPSSSNDGSANSFRDRLKRSESSGDSEVQIKLEDGRTMTGAYQFGDARLADYKKANEASFTTESFRKDPALQEKVFQWHMNDIDRAIADMPESKGMSKDGLRAVAHLGGVTGMKKYVKSGGKYNKSDKFGTKLSDYYAKFS
tara:strand:+ start:4813 stop:5511 length:699 start_codon:yes stop_codon:yes gene_type:complete